jgi:hypothetical protein
MLLASMLAQATPDVAAGGSGAVIFWLIGAGVILALWFLVSRTRKKSYNEYWARRKREQERRRNDPDMAPPPEAE